MKQNGCKLSYGEQRDAELYDEYKRQLPLHRKENGEIDNMAAIRAAVLQPCTRYWISENVALHKIRQILADGGKCLEGMIATKKRMYKDLMEVYYRLKAAPENAGLDDRQLAYMASDTQAKEYYMTPGSAILRICEERRRRKTEQNKHKAAEALLRHTKRKAAVEGALQEARRGATQSIQTKPMVYKRAEDDGLKHFGGMMKPKPLNWKIKKKARTALQYVIRFVE